MILLTGETDFNKGSVPHLLPNEFALQYLASKSKVGHQIPIVTCDWSGITKTI
jgi:hypothetical protein